MKDYLVRGMTMDSFVKVVAIRSTEMVSRAAQIHNTTPNATAAFGRALTAASMMGNMQKVEDGSMAQQIRELKLSSVRFGHGCRMFIVGLAKKVLLSNTLGTTFYAVSAMAPENVSVITGWIGAISYSLMLYFDFSGYSDMAIGIAKMFGFKFENNFDYPYMSASVSEMNWPMRLLTSSARMFRCSPWMLTTS